MPYCPESIRLFMLCEAMNFGVLPLAGGLYDQHPKLVEQWEEIMRAKSQEEKRKQARKNRQGSATMGRPQRPRRRGR